MNKNRNYWTKNPKITEQKTRLLALVEMAHYGMAEQTWIAEKTKIWLNKTNKNGWIKMKNEWIDQG